MCLLYHAANSKTGPNHNDHVDDWIGLKWQLDAVAQDDHVPHAMLKQMFKSWAWRNAVDFASHCCSYRLKLTLINIEDLMNRSLHPTAYCRVDSHAPRTVTTKEGRHTVLEILILNWKIHCDLSYGLDANPRGVVSFWQYCLVANIA